MKKIAVFLIFGFGYFVVMAGSAQASYSSEVLLDSPAAFWKLNETSGNTAVDSSGNGRNGTYTGTVSAFSGGSPVIGSTAVTFGSSQSVTYSANTNISGTFTVEAWVNAPSYSVVPTRKMILTSRTPSEYGFDFKIDNTGARIQGDIGNGSSWITTSANATTGFNINTWYHIAYVVTNSTYKIYRNGSLVGSGSFSSNTPRLINTSTHNIIIGNNSNASEYFPGSVSHVAIYTTALSQTRLQAHYDARNDLDTSATTTGNAGFGYNYFYAAGTVNNPTSETIWYGTKYGAGASYSSTSCGNLPNTYLYSTVGPGYNGTVNAYVSASASTLYYFCIFAWDQTNDIYYYSPTTSSLTTNSPPAPSPQNYTATLIDDTSATFHGGVNGYGNTSTAVFRWGTTNAPCSSLPNTSGTISAGSSNGNYYPVSYRVAGLTPGQVYFYCLTASSATGSSQSSVSQFTTAATAGIGCSMFPGSSLIDATDEALIDTYLGTAKMKGTLRYKMSTDGSTATAFHNAVDSYTGTIALYKSAQSNAVFGGFNPYAASGSGYQPAAASFLFNLTSDYKLNIGTIADNAIYRQPAYGPTFGGGHNIGIVNSNFTLSNTHYTNSSTAYYQSPAQVGAPTSYLHGGTVDRYFTPAEIEVYSISVCTQTTPTVTTGTADPTKVSATLNATANPNGLTSTGWFRYYTSNPGTCTDSGGVRVPTTSGTNLGSGTSAQPYSQNATGLSAGTTYYFCAFASNSQGTAVGSSVSFDTLPGTPQSVTADSVTSLGSYFATMNGTANPNGTASFAYFRFYTSDPASCVDSGGTRYPASQVDDLVLGSGTAALGFNYSLGTLTPQTTYYYCAFARNSYGITVSSTARTFATPAGATFPCDPPSSGNQTINGSCSYNGAGNGVDIGTGGTNTGVITVSSNRALTINPDQSIARSSVGGVGAVHIANGATVTNNPVWVIDSDNDGYVSSATQTVSASAPAGGKRRNTVSANYPYVSYMENTSLQDCNDASSIVYRTVSNLVRDEDNDGYVTSAAPSSQCVGATSVINGRTYYRDLSGAYIWLLDSQKLSSTADCQDNPLGVPCAPNNVFASNNSTSQNTVSWSGIQTGGAVPSATGYDLQWCTGPSCTPATTISSVTTPYLHNFSSAPNTTFRYRIASKNAAGAGSYSTSIGEVTTSSGLPSVPTGTSATSDNLNKRVNLSWIASLGNPTGYKIRWCAGTSCTPTSLITVGTATSYQFTTVTCGNAYSFTVAATNAEGDSNQSSVFTSSALATPSSSCYDDDDNDGYTEGAAVGVCGSSCPSGYERTSSSGTDCYDNNFNAKPGSNYKSNYDRGDGSYDYNCDGQQTRAYASVYMQNKWCPAASMSGSQNVRIGGGFCQNSPEYSYCNVTPTDYGAFGTPQSNLPCGMVKVGDSSENRDVAFSCSSSAPGNKHFVQYGTFVYQGPNASCIGAIFGETYYPSVCCY